MEGEQRAESDYPQALERQEFLRDLSDEQLQQEISEANDRLSTARNELNRRKAEKEQEGK
jgi:hypothetical protein